KAFCDSYLVSGRLRRLSVTNERDSSALKETRFFISSPNTHRETSRRYPHVKASADSIALQILFGGNFLYKSRNSRDNVCPYLISIRILRHCLSTVRENFKFSEWRCGPMNGTSDDRDDRCCTALMALQRAP